jgi:hypothetical protein
MASQLGARLLSIHAALDRAAIPHAFGGAIALAYWTLEPRGTRDLDVNAFIPERAYEQALEALPPTITVPNEARSLLARDGQARLWWDDTPVDLFLNTIAAHERAARNVRAVEFSGTTIPILDALDLAVFKGRFDRTKDWADIEAMFAARTLDPQALRERLLELLTADDDRILRIADAYRRGTGEAPPGAAPA